MSMDSKNDDRGLEADDDQALWDLLGRARSVEPSPYFVRRVLRDLDADAAGAAESPAGGWRAWWRPGWILAGSTAVLAAAFGLFTLSSIPVAQPPPVVRQPVAAVPAPGVVAPPAAVPVLDVPDVAAVGVAQAAPAESAAVFQLPADVRPQDVDVIADLDNLVAREETNAWTDDTSRF
jgi:hypothetical protein